MMEGRWTDAEVIGIQIAHYRAKWAKNIKEIYLELFIKKLSSITL